MFPADHDFRRYAIAQATAKRIAAHRAIEPGTRDRRYQGGPTTLGTNPQANPYPKPVSKHKPAHTRA